MTRGAELRANWRLVVAGALGFGFGLSGLPFYTFGVFVEPLSHAFGWKIAAIQAGLTVSYLTTMLLLPTIGGLVDRLGPRRVALTSVGLFSLAFMLLAVQTGSLWQFYLTWFLIALSGTGTLAVTWSRVTNGAFKSARGLALGLALLGSGVMGVVGPPVAAALVAALGWRAAYAILGLSPLLIAFPVIHAFLRPVHTAGTATVAQAEGLTLAQALRTPQLWIIGVSFLFIAGGVAGLIPNLIKIQTSAGGSRATATFAASLVGVFVILGRVSCGALMDRVWAPVVAAIYLCLPAGACLLLTQPGLGPGGSALAAACIGLAAGAEMDLLPYLVSRYFGLGRFGAILGFASAFFYLGASAGGLSLGAVYDITGSYRPALMTCAVLFLISVGGLLALGPYPNLPRLAEEPAPVDL
ncbi:MFS transporter [Phenylobacterium aquaticum]|uniref:MFS transporter n=1 Tax=Phenylobacterium aquaticum TaxID=1763816 RepID=UPI0026ED4AF2|nr:MFS transporter [Phenylobacterium aquaticum]